MMEVLISLAIASLSLLGTAALTVHSMQVNQGGKLRSGAVILASDILERMEANNTGALEQRYVIAAGDNIANPPDCVSSPCTPSQLAQFDLSQWRAAIATQLPSGAGDITAAASADAVTYTVVISWLDRRSKTTYANSGDTETVSFSVTKTIYDKSTI